MFSLVFAGDNLLGDAVSLSISFLILISLLFYIYSYYFCFDTSGDELMIINKQQWAMKKRKEEAHKEKTHTKNSWRQIKTDKTSFDILERKQRAGIRQMLP